MKNSVFKHYFRMYFLTILIPMIICCIYYAYMFFVIGSDDVAARKNDLIHSATLFDTLDSEIDYLADWIASTGEVSRFQKLTDVMVYPNTYKIKELQGALPDLSLANQSLYDYFIFFDRSETVINKSIAYPYTQFQKLYLRRTGLEEYDAWKAELTEKGKKNGYMPMDTYTVGSAGKSERLLAYTRPLQVYRPEESGYLFIYLDEDVIASMMPVPEEESIQTIQDFYGNVIYSKEECEGEMDEAELEAFLENLNEDSGLLQMTVRLSGNRYTFISYQSKVSGLRYSYFVPRKVINQRLVSCILIFLIFAVIGVITDLVLSYLISVRNATPINDILTQMSIDAEKIDRHQSIFTSLKDSVNELVDSNTDLSNALDMQKPYLKTAFVNRVLLSGLHHDKDISGMAEYLGWPLEHRSFCVLLFRFHMLSDTDAADEKNQIFFSTFTASLAELIEKKMPGSLYTDLGEGQLALIMNEEADQPEALISRSNMLVEQLKAEMASVLAQKVFVYGGSIEQTPDKIPDSYRNASYMCYEEDEQIENDIIWYDEGDHHSINYPSDDMQVKLTHYVTSGDEKGLHDYLEGIVRKYLVEADLPVYLQHMLVADLQTILFRLLGIIKLEDDEYAAYYTQLEKNYNKPVLNQISITLNLFRDLCRFMNQQKKMQDSDMIASGIVSFVEAHYNDPDLSLALIADQFDISQSYLSCLFKQTQGVNISSFIENIRIEKAKDLLKTTDLTIVRISEMTGYGSTNSFCRAFKRVTGMSTSEYRKC